ncbi:MAG: glycosyltransferase [Caldithrix sp.]|nr:glycosyltransferase [Caldithrix sp.]
MKRPPQEPINTDDFKGCIVCLTPGFPADASETDNIPALQNYVKYLARINSDYHVIVITFRYPRQPQTYIWNHITIYALGIEQYRKIARPFIWLRATLFLIKLHRKVTIKVLHSFWLSETALVGKWVSRLTGAKHITSLMGQDALPIKRYIRYLNLKGMIITAPSVFIENEMLRNNGRPIDAVIPWGLDRETEDQDIEGSDRSIDILGVGSLIPLKNYRTFIEIIQRLAVDFSHIRSVIIGDGPQRDALQSLIDKLRLTDNVQLTGGLARERVFEYMKFSKILLHPSLYEAQAYVFLEALYYGLMVVSYDVGYLPYTPKSYIVRTKDDLYQKTAKALEQHHVGRSYLPLTMEYTVAQFNKLYGIG